MKKSTLSVAKLIRPAFSLRAPACVYLAITFCTTGVPAFARPQAIASPAVYFTPVEVRGAVNYLGFDGIKPNSGGSLIFRRDTLSFSSGTSSSSIPFAAIRDVSIEHSTKGLLRGTPGVMASFAPQGIGQVYSLFRPGAETLTIFYVDRYQALHGAVILLPKDRKADVVQAFTRAGLDLEALPHPAPAGYPQEWAHRIQSSSAETREAAVRIALPTAQASELPKAYVAATYEQLIVQLDKTNAYLHVWRVGDVRAGPESSNLSVTITRAKKGNAGVRGAIPVVGMIAGKTLLEADVRLVDASGVTLLDAPFKGSKRLPGESIGATQSLAQRVVRTIEKLPSENIAGGSSRVASRY